MVTTKFRYNVPVRNIHRLTIICVRKCVFFIVYRNCIQMEGDTCTVFQFPVRLIHNRKPLFLLYNVAFEVCRLLIDDCMYKGNAADQEIGLKPSSHIRKFVSNIIAVISMSIWRLHI